MNNRSFFIILVIIAVFAPLFVLVEWDRANSRVSRPNFEKVEVGMTEAQVREVLGPGKTSRAYEGGKVVSWQDRFGDTVIRVTFEGGKVTAKEIRD
jgi:hypothetical protein